MSIKHRINKYLRKFNVELHGLGYLQSLAKSDFKNSEKDIFLKVYNQDDTICIFDVGANKGLMIDEYIKSFPNALIHAFEPFPGYGNRLKDKYVNNKRININICGVSNFQGQEMLNVNHSIDTSSLLTSVNTGLNSDKQVKTVDRISIDMNTIDHYMSQLHIKHIHILKLDIQGSELNALIGAQKTLLAKKIDFIFTEAYFIQQYQNQPLFHQIVDLLLKYGYVLQDIYNPIYGNSKLAWCDALFVRSDLKF